MAKSSRVRHAYRHLYKTGAFQKNARCCHHLLCYRPERSPHDGRQRGTYTTGCAGLNGACGQAVPFEGFQGVACEALGAGSSTCASSKQWAGRASGVPMSAMRRWSSFSTMLCAWMAVGDMATTGCWRGAVAREQLRLERRLREAPARRQESYGGGRYTLITVASNYPMFVIHSIVTPYWC